MSDAITISGGGTTAVATDDLFADAARLGAAVAALEAAAGDAAGLAVELDALGADRDAGGFAGRQTLWNGPHPAGATHRLECALRDRRAEGDELRSALIASAERYGLTEQLVDGAWRVGGGVAGYLLGSFLVSPGGAALAGGVALAAGANTSARQVWGATALDEWLAANRGVLSDPLFVRAVRAAVDSVDEFVLGALHVPGGEKLAALIGPHVGAPESASVLLALAAALRAPALVDGPVRVRRTDRDDRAGDGQAPGGHPSEGPERTVRAPAGFGDLAGRIPGGEGPQIRIERYGEPGDPRWVVYVSGTVELGVVAGEQPFDMVNNLHGIADDSPLDALRRAGASSGAGERAVREAMSAAGIAPDDPVLVAGHSGGGIIGARLAGDPSLGVIGALDLGGPNDSAPTRPGVPNVAVEHTEDLVPALGGAGHPSPERIVVARDALEPGRSHDGEILPAHSLERYRQTAALMDESDDPRLAEFRELLAFTGGGEGAVSEWVARRQ